MAGPCFRNILSEVLPYLGIERIYSQEEIGNLDTTTGAYVGAAADQAEAIVSQDGLKAKIVGSGDMVIAQNPSAYTAIPKDGTVILYTDENDKTTVTVPDFSNLTLTEVNRIAAEYDLNISIKGSLSSEGSSYAKTQDIAPNTEVEPYTVVTVTFNQDNSIM